jgi:hypothetical protein
VDPGTRGTPIASVVFAMKVRLTKKLAECIDGVELNDARVGDVLDLPAPQARLLLAEQWAVPHRPTRPKASRNAGSSAKRTHPQYSTT